MSMHVTPLDAADAGGRTVAGHLRRLRPADKGTGAIPVGAFASGHAITIPYLVARGAADGPCLWINAAVHGDEINGVLAASDFFAELDPAELKGTVVVTPVSNPLGFDARRKRVPQDGLDLDQSFPGRADGLASERLAWALSVEMRDLADVVVSFHTMNPYFDSRPYAVYKTHPDAAVSEGDLLAAAACFSPTVACLMPVSSSGNELPGNNAGALDYQALRAGCTAFMVELGAGSRQEPGYVRQGVRGLRALAGRRGLLPPVDGAEPRVRRVTRRAHVTASQGGLFRMEAQPGALVPAGTPVGRVQDLAGRTVEEFAFDRDAIVIGIRTDPVVHTGDRVAFMAFEWDDVDV